MTRIIAGNKGCPELLCANGPLVPMRIKGRSRSSHSIAHFFGLPEPPQPGRGLDRSIRPRYIFTNITIQTASMDITTNGVCFLMERELQQTLAEALDSDSPNEPRGVMN